MRSVDERIAALKPEITEMAKTIHAWFDVSGDEKIRTHMLEFVKCTASEYGLENMYKQTAALILTGLGSPIRNNLKFNDISRNVCIARSRKHNIWFVAEF